MKKLIALLLTVLMLSNASFIFADFTNASNEMDKIAQSVLEMIPMVLKRELKQSDVIVIGSKLSTYGITMDGTVTESQYDSYPLLINGKIEGIVDVIRNGTGDIYQIALGIDYASQLQNEIEKNKERSFAILHADNGVYIKPANEPGIKQLLAYNETPAIAMLHRANLEYSNITEVMSTTYSQTPSSRYIDTNVLDVEWVGNSSCPACSEGLCWAASIGMIVNYYNGTSYSARNILDIVGCLFESENNYHDDEKDYISHFGLSAAGPYYSFAYTTVSHYIDSNILLLLDLQDYVSEVAHNVVVNGYYSSVTSSTQYFYFMDPNTQDRACTFPESSGSTVYVPLGSYNYQVHCYITAGR